MLERMRRIRRARPVLPPPSAFTGFRFPREVILLAVRWYYVTDSRIAILKSCWPSVECRSTGTDAPMDVKQRTAAFPVGM
jgi:hypothetical protein